MENVRLSLPLGVYEDRVEFQVERTIVQVEIPPQGERFTWLEIAERQFPEVWGAIPNVIELAQKILQSELAGFLTSHNEAHDSDVQLSVWGIWISPVDGSATYNAGCYNPFNSNDPTAPPGLPDQIDVMIERDATGRLQARSEKLP